MSLLEEIVSSITALPPDARATVMAQAAAVKKRMAWIPSPGPQTEAYFSKADVLLYGGAGGGGKTDLGLGLAFTAHRRSLILRRQYSNLSALTERAIKINGTRNGFNGSAPPLLRTADDRYIQFAGNQHTGDEQAWQGHPFDFKCVGRGTPVLMGDGQYRAIETLVAGEMVQTLEGPRRIVRVFPMRVASGVVATLWDEGGEVIGRQVQSEQHALLTSSGWVSRDMCDGSRPHDSFVPKGFRFGRIFERLFAATCGLSRSLRAGPVWGYRRVAARSLLRLDRQFAWAPCASGALVFRGSDYAAFGGGHQERLPRPGLTGRRGLLERFRQSSGGCGSGSICGIRSCDGRSCSTLQGWLGRCLSGIHRCGERVLRVWDRGFVVADGLAYLRPQDGVGRPTPSDFGGGGRGRTPRHSRRIDRYAHPYTNEIRPSDRAEAVSCALTFSPLGRDVELFDLEIDEANHYITSGGFINKNCFDEASQFLESMIRFHLGWLRTTDEGQRTRAVLASNPPMDSTGDWMIGMFRPWLDVTHPNPAKSGELRWFVVTPDGKDMEVSGPEPVRFPGEERDVLPTSRTFIPAALRDNPFLVNSGYQAQLDSLPEPIRSAVRDGNFMAARKDGENQVIPTQWVIEAQARWSERPPEGIPMCAMALDPAGGGDDENVLACRHDGWFGTLVVKPGKDAVTGADKAALIVAHRRDSADIVIDMGGGYGSAVYEHLADNKLQPISYKGAESATGRTRDGKLAFENKRSQTLWRLREALDPGQPGGSNIALPPDPMLRSDLTAPTFTVTPRGIKVEAKDDVKDKLGRSPDRGDAVMMCWAEGQTALTPGFPRVGRRQDKLNVKLGHANAKAKRRGR